MADDFLLTGEGASTPLTRELVAWADHLEAALQALDLISQDVAVVALRPEEIAAVRAAVAAAHGAGRDLRLIATTVQHPHDGGTHP